jgi:hypothetical protein
MVSWWLEGSSSGHQRVITIKLLLLCLACRALSSAQSFNLVYCEYPTITYTLGGLGFASSNHIANMTISYT